jgi:hypothetical protein
LLVTAFIVALSFSPDDILPKAPARVLIEIAELAVLAPA